MIWLLVACHSEGEITGTARDELRLQPLPEVLLIPENPSARCPPARVVPASDFSFSATVCTSLAYTVSYAPGANGIYWRGDTPTARGGDHVDLHAWPAASEPGVYVLGERLTRISAPVAVEANPVLPTGVVVRYPLELPESVARVLPGEFLLLQGEFGPHAITPVGRSTTPLTFARAAPPTLLGPWAFIGADISADGVVTALSPPELPAPITSSGGGPLRWVHSDLLPAGRYAITTTSEHRVYLVDVGPPPDPAPG